MKITLDVSQINVQLRAEQQLLLPAFAGSKLEGAFGRALYDMSCVQKDLPNCTQCSLRQLCSYGQLYAPLLPQHLEVQSLQSPPRPLVFVVEHQQERTLQPGEVFEFGIRIFGKAIDQLPYVIAAIKKMGPQGMGLARGRFTMLRTETVNPVTGERHLMTSEDSPVVQHHNPIRVSMADFAPLNGGRIVVDIKTMLHIAVAGKFVDTIQFPVLVRALQRRVGNLEQIYGEGLTAGQDFSMLPRLAKDVELVEHNVQHVTQRRKGSNPKQSVTMHGWVGTLVYEGDIAPFASLLRYGEQVGVGKWAHFGAGRYAVHINNLEQ